MDALVAGAGRRDVRAGVPRLLSTIPSVEVADATVAGRPALVLRSTGFPDDHEERLLIDADTGVPARLEGGPAGARPHVVIDYEVERVDAAGVSARWAGARGGWTAAPAGITVGPARRYAPPPEGRRKHDCARRAVHGP